MSRKIISIITMIVTCSMFGAACSPSAAPAAAIPGAQVTEPAAVNTEAPQPVVVNTEAPQPTKTEQILARIQARGKLICGINGSLPAFSYLNEKGEYAGFDIDFCKVIAAAVLGDPTKVEYRKLTSEQRFTALQSGEVDMVNHTTTHTLTRDAELKMAFAPSTFYDGQGIIVHKDAGIKTLEDLNGATICIETGTTTELNLADQMAARNLSYTPVVFENYQTALAAYSENRCEAYTTDVSGLIAYLGGGAIPNPEKSMILPVTLSKEPLGPLAVDGDPQWNNILRWSVYVTFAAEEHGITSTNVDEMKASSKDPEVKRLLGVEGEMGKKLGLSNEWAYNIIKLVGNYGEIFDRNLGPKTPYNMPRGVNALWTNGGLMYAPPIR
jgi:general L-amino acid transport system substrate-binding protein